MTFFDKVVFYIQFGINKHGQYCGKTSVEEVINSLTPYEVLLLLTDAIDNPPEI